jgi:CheY-like chemotaxis protein
LNEDRPRIVVADDSEDFVATLSQLLRGNGYEVLVAYDGATALELATREEPLCVMLDIRMPGGGPELARELRGRLGGGAVLIGMSGLDADAADANSVRGIVDYLFAKPIDIALLEQMLPPCPGSDGERRLSGTARTGMPP